MLLVLALCRYEVPCPVVCGHVVICIWKMSVLSVHNSVSSFQKTNGSIIALANATAATTLSMIVILSFI